MLIKKNAKDSNICHIEAAERDGERYREDMTDKERADYENLILLCIQHHDETNDIEKYSVDVLKKMKQEHESKQLRETIQKNPSMLNNLINKISNIDIDDNRHEIEVLNVFNIQDKIDYNSVKKYAPKIQEYKVYHHKLDSLYNELEAQGSLKKQKVLSIIRGFYLEAKGNYINPDLHADDIIDDIKNFLYNELNNNGHYEEDILLGIDLVIVDAFMRCKILEEPRLS